MGEGVVFLLSPRVSYSFIRHFVLSFIPFLSSLALCRGVSLGTHQVIASQIRSTLGKRFERYDNANGKLLCGKLYSKEWMDIPW